LKREEVTTGYAAMHFPDGRWKFSSVVLNSDPLMKLHESRPIGNCESCDGHDTQEEAELHFAEWMADGATLDIKIGSNRFCYVCRHLTGRSAEGPLDFKIPLCRKHMNRGGVIQSVLKIVRSVK
jgi:hypothetical protein